MEITVGRIILWIMLAVQCAAWAWIQYRGGKLEDKKYLIFCLGLMTGQLAGSIECYITQAWGTGLLQVYFFFWTGWGGIVRYRQMRASHL